jgi:hypothetical protein
MDNFAPGLRDSVLVLTDAFRVVVYFVCVLGLMLQIQQARTDAESLARPVIRATVIVGLVATLPYWFGFIERLLLSVANTVQDGYTEHPMRAALRLREAVGGGTEFSLRRIGESMYQAFLYAAGKLVVLIASLLQLPFLVLQFVLKLLCYLFLPVALALFMIPSQGGLAGRYVQQTLAVLAWPVGFSVTELVAYHLLTAYSDNLAVAYDLAPGSIDGASFASLLGALLAAIWLIIGTIGTPFLMQALIASGSPLSIGGGQAMQQLFALQQLARAVTSLKSGGLAAAAAYITPSGKSGPGAPPSSPSAVPPAPTPPPAPISPAADALGDQRANAALASGQMPTARTTI